MPRQKPRFFCGKRKKMTKQNGEKNESEYLNYPGDRLESSNRNINRNNQETLAAIEEGRRIAADAAHPAFNTMEELKAALEK